jgi:hypothetical protein
MFKIAHHIAGAGLLIGAAAASAGDLPPGMADSVMNSCRPDYQRLCSFVVPGEGRAARCLLDHERELAPNCLMAIKIALAIEACMPDYRRYCEGIPRGREAFNCLASQGGRLQPGCRKVVDANAPYMDPHDGRYAYRGEAPYPDYRGPAPYGDGRGPAPYAERGPAPYGAGPGAAPYTDRGPAPYGDGPGPAPYADRGPGAYGDGRGPAPYGDGRGPERYGEAPPYGDGGPAPYAYRGNPRGEEPDADEDEPRGRAPEGYPYGDRPGYPERYAEQPPRMMPYGYRGPSGPGYDGGDRERGAPGEGPAPGEERE